MGGERQVMGTASELCRNITLGIWGVWNRVCEVEKGLLVARAVPTSLKPQLASDLVSEGIVLTFPLSPVQTHAQTPRHTSRHRYMHTLTHTHRHIHTQTQIDTQTYTHRNRPIQRHIHAGTHIEICTDTHRHMYTQIQT